MSASLLVCLFVNITSWRLVVDRGVDVFLRNSKSHLIQFMIVACWVAVELAEVFIFHGNWVDASVRFLIWRRVDVRWMITGGAITFLSTDILVLQISPSLLEIPSVYSNIYLTPCDHYFQPQSYFSHTVKVKCRLKHKNAHQNICRRDNSVLVAILSRYKTCIVSEWSFLFFMRQKG